MLIQMRTSTYCVSRERHKHRICSRSRLVAWHGSKEGVKNTHVTGKSVCVRGGRVEGGVKERDRVIPYLDMQDKYLYVSF